MASVKVGIHAITLVSERRCATGVSYRMRAAKGLAHRLDGIIPDYAAS